MVAPSPSFFVCSIANTIPAWPGWDSVDATTRIGTDAQLAAIGFFFTALIIEVLALGAEDDKREKKIARIGLLFSSSVRALSMLIRSTRRERSF